MPKYEVYVLNKAIIVYYLKEKNLLDLKYCYIYICYSENIATIYICLCETIATVYIR